LDTDKLYYTPQLSDWPVFDAVNCVFTLLGDATMVSLLNLTHDEAYALAIVNLYCDHRKEQKGKAIPNHKKTSLCRAEWKKAAVEPNLPTARSKAAYTWLLENNPTYARYISRHNEILASDAKNRFYITTANLFLHEHGIEVAMRPCLYPREGFGDSDVNERLLRLGRITETQKSSIRTSFLRKCQSRCLKYAQDYMLCF